MAEINPVYLKEQMIKAIRQKLQTEGSVSVVTLADFLVEKEFKRLCLELSKLSYVSQKHPLQHSYSSTERSHMVQELVLSEKLGSFISKIIGKTPSLFQIRRFGWKDYTILHDEAEALGEFEVFFDASSEWDVCAGGALMYVDGIGEYFKVPVCGNQLIIVRRSRGVQRFVQYVNHHAQNQWRYLVELCF